MAGILMLPMWDFDSRGQARRLCIIMGKGGGSDLCLFIYSFFIYSIFAASVLFSHILICVN